MFGNEDPPSTAATIIEFLFKPLALSHGLDVFMYVSARPETVGGIRLLCSIDRMRSLIFERVYSSPQSPSFPSRRNRQRATHGTVILIPSSHALETPQRAIHFQIQTFLKIRVIDFSVLSSLR